jgi:cell fate (sporulation/competence/biofilm development) regulator YlbF (YheA/YmcA/DUF963 family)
MRVFAKQMQEEGIVKRNEDGSVKIDPATGKAEMVIRSYKDMVEEKKSDVAQGQGHERSLNAMMKHKIKNFERAVANAQERMDNGEIDDISKDEKVQEFTAKLENMGEASAYFSGANRELVSKVLRGEEVTGLADTTFKVAKEETTIPALKIHTTVTTNRPVRLPNGEIDYETVADPSNPGQSIRRAKMEPVPEPKELNIRQLADEKMRSDKDHPVYNTNKREFGRVQAEQEAAERLANTGIGPVPGQGA